MKKKMKHTRSGAENISLAARLLSRSMMKDGLGQATEEDTPFCLLIDDIKMLKLSSFIRCYTTSDLSELVLAGSPADGHLQSVWESLKLQYYDASANTTALQANEKQTLINAYILFINRVRLNMEALTVHYSDDLIAELREDGFDYSFTRETWNYDLQRISNELIGWEIKKEQLEKEQLEQLQAGNNISFQPTEEYFLEQLAELRKFEGYNIPVTRLAHELTVYDYCVAMKRYTQHLKQLQTQPQHHGI